MLQQARSGQGGIIQTFFLCVWFPDGLFVFNFGPFTCRHRTRQQAQEAFEICFLLFTLAGHNGS